MFNNAKETMFDAILTVAFNEYWERELAKMPSDEELKEMYPIPKKELATAKRMEKRKKYGKPLAIVYLQRACIIVLVLVAVVFALLSTSPTIRAAIGDSFTSWFEDHVVIDFTDDPVAPVEIKNDKTTDSNAETEPASVQTLKIGYIPEGFELISEEVTDNTRYYMYASDSGDYFIINISDSSYSNTQVDTDYTNYEIIILNEIESYLLYNEADNMGTLVHGNDSYILSISGIMHKTEIIKIAENIH